MEHWKALSGNVVTRDAACETQGKLICTCFRLASREGIQFAWRRPVQEQVLEVALPGRMPLAGCRQGLEGLRHLRQSKGPIGRSGSHGGLVGHQKWSAARKGPNFLQQGSRWDPPATLGFPACRRRLALQGPADGAPHAAWPDPLSPGALGTSTK